MQNSSGKIGKGMGVYVRLAAYAFGLTALAAGTASAATVNAVFNSAGSVPVMSSNYTATGNSVSFTLNFSPVTGTDLTVVNNTALDFIDGTFNNLTNGQLVVLSYGGTNYTFVANYYGGTGNDLVLVWANTRVFAWGSNYDGEIGDNIAGNISVRRLTPVAVDTVTAPALLSGKTVIGLAGGFAHSYALCSEGTLGVWGNNTDTGQLGNPDYLESLVPVTVNLAAGTSALYGKRVVSIASGSGFGLALCSDGSLSAWGDDSEGFLGDNGMASPHSHVPVTVNTSSNLSALYGKKVVMIAAGAHHSVAACSDGTLAAWGYGHVGELGDNTTSNRFVPVKVNADPGVSALDGKMITAIACGNFHSLALCSDGTIAAWGGNNSGQIGDNTNANRLVPVAVSTAPGVSALAGKTVVAISAGDSHSLALCSDGTVAAWGRNSDGELGDNTTITRFAPVAVNTNAGVSALYGKTVISIAAGIGHNLALCSDGTLAAWGLNGLGQLGDTTLVNRKVPVAVNAGAVAAFQRFTHIANVPGANHSLALVSSPPVSIGTFNTAPTMSNGVFRLSFSNTPGAFVSVLAATNLALPLNAWTPIGGLTEAPPGRFQLTDSQVAVNPQRFYRVRSP